jgi:hypothetical protein
VTPNGQEIVDVVVGKPGQTSGLNIGRSTQTKLAFLQRFKGDKGYVGASFIDTPPKKPRSGELNGREKPENREKASQRIFVEHRIRVIKIFRRTQKRFRLKKRNYERVIIAICGLMRLRVGA